MSLESRDIIILFIISVLIFMIYCKINNLDSFKSLNYGNYSTQHKPCSYNSWSNVFYSENDRYNTCYPVLPSKNQSKHNIPLPHNVHTGQTINVGKTDLVKQIGSPIETEGTEIPDKLYEKSGQESDLDSQSVVHELPLNEEIEKFEGEHVDINSENIKDVDIEVIAENSIENIVENGVENGVEEEVNKYVEKIKEKNGEKQNNYYNIYILILLLLLFGVAFFC